MRGRKGSSSPRRIRKIELRFSRQRDHIPLSKPRKSYGEDEIKNQLKESTNSYSPGGKHVAGTVCCGQAGGEAEVVAEYQTLKVFIFKELRFFSFFLNFFFF